MVGEVKVLVRHALCGLKQKGVTTRPVLRRDSLLLALHAFKYAIGIRIDKTR